MNNTKTYKLIVGTNACCSRLSAIRNSSATFVQDYNKNNTDIRLELQLVNIANIDKVVTEAIHEQISYKTGKFRRYDYKTRQYVEETRAQSFRDFLHIDGYGVRLSTVFDKQAVLDLLEEAKNNDSTTTK
jgi:hypothetical protein